MCEAFDTARRGPRSPGILQCLAGACCACVLLVTAASGREPNRSGAVSVIGERNHGTPAPVGRLPELTSTPTEDPESDGTFPSAQSPLPGVRFADLQDADGPDASGSITQVAADADSAAVGESATLGVESPPATVSPASGAARSTRPRDPLSRLAWSDSPSPIDPGQTLRDWAEGAGLLVGFGIVALWLVRQWVARKEFPGGTATQVRSVETLNLPQRCRIHLIEVQGRHVLVAMDPAGVKSVTVLPDRFPAILAAETDDADGNTAPPHEADRGSAWNTLRESRIT